MESVKTCGGDRQDHLAPLIDDAYYCAGCILDSTGNVTHWTKAAEAATGYANNEILGQHISVLYTPESVSRGEPALDLQAARELGRQVIDGWRVNAKSDSTLTRITLESLCCDNGSTGFAITLGNHKTLQSTDLPSVPGLGMYEDALGHMPVGMALFDSAETLVFANNKFCDLLGLPNDSIRAGMSLREIMRLEVIVAIVVQLEEPGLAIVQQVPAVRAQRHALERLFLLPLAFFDVHLMHQLRWARDFAGK